MIVIAIPARLESSRLKHKLLCDIAGYPLLWWTWQKALQSKLANKVIIATDSQDIQARMEAYGAECILTSSTCRSGSDRIFEAVQKLESVEYVVNLQGDEPLMEAALLDSTIQLLQENPACDIASCAVPFLKQEDWENPNNVKVVIDNKKKALYFSRAPLASQHCSYLHLGLYAFQKEALLRFCHLKPSSLEQTEKLEQLRALENGMSIQMYVAQEQQQHFGIDTPDDLARAKKLLEQQSSL